MNSEIRTCLVAGRHPWNHKALGWFPSSFTGYLPLVSRPEEPTETFILYGMPRLVCGLLDTSQTHAGLDPDMDGRQASLKAVAS